MKLKKYYSGNINNDENYEEIFKLILAGAKREIFEFLDNVKVNEENANFKKKQIGTFTVCYVKPFTTYINFSIIEIANNE